MNEKQTEDIEQIIQRQQEAWNRGDAAGYSQDCEENVSFTNIIGQTLFGRAAFEEKHVQIFASVFKGSSLSMSIKRAYIPTPGIAVVDIEATLEGYRALPPGIQPPKDEILRTKLLQTLVHSDGKWRVVAYHNVDIKS